jgi:hypothetical protein
MAHAMQNATRMKWALLIVTLLAGCDDDAGSPADAAADAAMCVAPNVMRYEIEGCDKQPVCGSMVMDLCARMVCSCKGKVLIGCDFYSEPWTSALKVPPGAQAGDSCSTD